MLVSTSFKFTHVVIYPRSAVSFTLVRHGM